MSTAGDLTSGRLLARNTVINLVGEVLPFAVGVVALPILIHRVGVDRYGILALSAMVVGYFGLFDFGLGAAATKLIAEAAGSGGGERIPGLFWTSLVLMVGFGTCGAILIATLGPWLVGHFFRISPALRAEALPAFYLLAFSLPFVVSAGSLRGTLAAFQRFDLINGVRVPMGVFSYVGPLVVLPFSHRLPYLVAVMLFGRLVAWLASLFLCLRFVPGLLEGRTFSRATAWPMLRFGGWVTVSNIVGPIMVYFDRFMIGAMISMAAVAYYAVPYQVATKIWIVTGALQGVLFAAFSSGFRPDPKRTALLFERAVLLLLFALFPVVLAIVALAPEGLRLWLGPQFAVASTGALRWLVVGAFVNGLAWVPASLVVAAHRPDIAAKLHLAEVPFYCLFLWWILPRYGIEGAAIAWTVRVLADAIVLSLVARRLLPAAASAIARTAPLIALAGLLFCAAFAFQTLAGAVPFLAFVMTSSALLTWAMFLRPDEKDIVRNCFRVAGAFSMGLKRSWF